MSTGNPVLPLRMHLARRLRRQFPGLPTFKNAPPTSSSSRPLDPSCSLEEYEEALRARIDTYITTAHTMYDRQSMRWTQLQPAAGIQLDTDKIWVYSAFVSVIETIANDFYLLDLGDRELKNTSEVRISHLNMGEPAYDEMPFSRPDLCIIGVGDSLSPLKNMATIRTSLTYRNVRNMADIKQD